MSLSRGKLVVLAAAAAILTFTAPVVAGDPFSMLVGTWAGKGTARLERPVSPSRAHLYEKRRTIPLCVKSATKCRSVCHTAQSKTAL